MIVVYNQTKHFFFFFFFLLRPTSFCLSLGLSASLLGNDAVKKKPPFIRISTKVSFLDVGLQGWVSSRSLYQRYTVHERALYLKSTFYIELSANCVFFFPFKKSKNQKKTKKRKGACVDPLKYFQFCELKVYESKKPFLTY